METKDMKGTVLVTGGLGYLGYHVTDELLKEGYKARVMDLMLYGFEPDKCHEDKHYEFVKGDIRNENDVQNALEGVDYVIHLAALSNDPSCDLLPDKSIDINYNGTKLVSTMAKKLGVRRFIFPSSCSVYGLADQKIVSEKDKVNPLTLYAQTKLASEAQLVSLVDKTFDVGILRFPTLFGHSCSMRFDLVANIIPLEAFEGEIQLFGGAQFRPLLHVKDAARALVIALKHDEPLKGEVFNVGNSDQNYTIRELTELIQKNIFPEAGIRECPENIDMRSYQVDFTKIKKILGYETRTDILQGVSEIAEKLRLKEYGNPRDIKYFRAKYLKNNKMFC